MEHKDIQPGCPVYSPQPRPFTYDHTLNQERDIITIAQDKQAPLGMLHDLPPSIPWNQANSQRMYSL